MGFVLVRIPGTLIRSSRLDVTREHVFEREASTDMTVIDAGNGGDFADEETRRP